MARVASELAHVTLRKLSGAAVSGEVQAGRLWADKAVVLLCLRRPG
jgi:hypothetical protein